ncbi:hypothetical protein LTWDN19_06080 [Latilactobacillus curvatus]|uniref:Uncharacterized protein n=1 Tax=Latilactobacillus curvatus TaxID=28038 RepID=A0ABM7QTZ3_LATCU|nr:hypothetical protein LTWDN19_06080 [Latilactobacillus curvatus]
MPLLTLKQKSNNNLKNEPVGCEYSRPTGLFFCILNSLLKLDYSHNNHLRMRYNIRMILIMALHQ